MGLNRTVFRRSSRGGPSTTRRRNLLKDRARDLSEPSTFRIGVAMTSTTPGRTGNRSDRPVRIGNASGFYGDRFSAMREMLEGGELDYLTGDYLAELTMLILGRDRLKDPKTGYAKTFLRQMEECLGLAVDKGLAERLRKVKGKAEEHLRSDTSPRHTQMWESLARLVAYSGL